MGKTVREFILGEAVVKALEVVEAQAAERAALIDDLLVRPTLAKSNDDEEIEPKQKAERRPYVRRTGPMIDGVRQDAVPKRKRTLL